MPGAPLIPYAAQSTRDTTSKRSRRIPIHAPVTSIASAVVYEVQGRTEFGPKDYMRTLVGDDEFVQPKRNETAPWSECRLTFKNTLTQPRLLEMDVKPAHRRSAFQYVR